MKDPEIIFCEKGHIYDASLYDECPYCIKVDANKKKLSSIVGDNTENNNYSYNVSESEDETTELLVEQDEKTELVDSDGETEKTELLEVEEITEKTELLELDEETEKTELLDLVDSEVSKVSSDSDVKSHNNTVEAPSYKSTAAPEENASDRFSKIRKKFQLADDSEIVPSNVHRLNRTSAISSEGYTCGWLVCINGFEKGLSYPLQKKTFISDMTDGGMTTRERLLIEYSRKNGSSGIEIYMNSDEEFVLEAGRDVDCQVDELSFTRPKKLYPYARIKSLGREFIFVPFVGSQYKWED